MLLTSELYGNPINLTSYKKHSTQEECQHIQEYFVSLNFYEAYDIQ
jgi:hypothetical protein